MKFSCKICKIKKHFRFFYIKKHLLCSLKLNKPFNFVEFIGNASIDMFF